MKKTIAIVLVLALSVFALSGCAPKEEPEVIAYFAPGESMVVNIAESYRLLKMAPVLVVNQADLEETLKAMQPLIRDVINNLMRDKTDDVLKGPGIMDIARAEIIEVLHEKLGMTYVVDVYFSDFVVQ